MAEYVGCGNSFQDACTNLELYLRGCKKDEYRVQRVGVAVKNPRYKEYKRQLKRGGYTTLGTQPKKIIKKKMCAYIPNTKKIYRIEHLKNGQNGIHIARIYIN